MIQNKLLISVLFIFIMFNESVFSQSYIDKYVRVKIYYITATDIPFVKKPEEVKKYAGTIIDTYSSAHDIYNLITDIEYKNNENVGVIDDEINSVSTTLEFYDKNGSTVTYFGTHNKIYNEDFTKYVYYTDFQYKTIQILKLIFPNLCHTIPLKEGEKMIITMMNTSCYGLDDEFF